MNKITITTKDGHIFKDNIRIPDRQGDYAGWGIYRYIAGIQHGGRLLENRKGCVATSNLREADLIATKRISPDQTPGIDGAGRQAADQTPGIDGAGRQISASNSGTVEAGQVPNAGIPQEKPNVGLSGVGVTLEQVKARPIVGIVHKKS